MENLVTDEKSVKKSKYYNPYPFPVRVLDDTGNIYVLAPQDKCKIMNGVYTQSALNIVPADKKERMYKPGMDLNLKKMIKKELLKVAWAVCIDDLTERKTVAQIIDTILVKIGEKE